MKDLIVDEIFNPYTLNIFTDASVKMVGNYFIACPGAVAVTTFNGMPYICNQQAYLSYDSTNNSGEIQAVRLGIFLANMYKHRFRVINLFADSNICISGLNLWLDSWIKNSKDGMFVNSSRKLVENQDTFKNIIDDIITNKLYINFYHQKGHVDVKNKDSMDNAIDVFRRINNINPSTNLIENISKYNNEVDIMTKVYLDNIEKSLIGMKTQKMVYRDFYNNKQGLDQFRNITNQFKKG